jgi:hypothetical protein
MDSYNRRQAEGSVASPPNAGRPGPSPSPRALRAVDIRAGAVSELLMQSPGRMLSPYGHRRRMSEEIHSSHLEHLQRPRGPMPALPGEHCSPSRAAVGSTHTTTPLGIKLDPLQGESMGGTHDEGGGELLYRPTGSRGVRSQWSGVGRGGLNLRSAGGGSDSPLTSPLRLRKVVSAPDSQVPTSHSNNFSGKAPLRTTLSKCEMPKQPTGGSHDVAKSHGGGDSNRLGTLRPHGDVEEAARRRLSIPKREAVLRAGLDGKASRSSRGAGEPRRSHLDVMLQNEKEIATTAARGEPTTGHLTLEVSGGGVQSVSKARLTLPGGDAEAIHRRRAAQDGAGSTSARGPSAHHHKPSHRRENMKGNQRITSHRRDAPRGSASASGDNNRHVSQQNSPARRDDNADEHVRDLVRAVHANDVGWLEQLLDGPHRAAVNVRHPETRRSALHEGVAAMRPGMVARLLQSGADPDVPHESQGPPLLHCAAWGETELASLLLDKGANVNAADALGFTALHYACQMGHGGAVQVECMQLTHRLKAPAFKP